MRNVRFCKTCGAPAHGPCALKDLQAKQDPFGMKRRPPPPVSGPSDPALRDANDRTMFLIPTKR
jgi:hypothetical protein